MTERLAKIRSQLKNETFRYDPNSERFPTRKQLPAIPGAVDGAAWFWGEDDELGRLNLLTPARSLAATKEVSKGIVVPLNLTVGEPTPPCFGRQPFKHTIKSLSDYSHAFDDFYDLNTQSGSQWDGFRHFSHMATKTFYNNTQPEDIIGPHANTKCGVQAWAKKGIVGRGVLLDFATWAAGRKRSYDIFDPASAISYSTLVAVGKSQGIDIRPAAQGGDIQVGDLLLVRSGFIAADRKLPTKERETKHAPPDGEQRYMGLEQSDEILDWLHDSYFAAVAGDAPSFEAWPTRTGYYLHEYLLARWGIPIGELWDLEGLAERCYLENRYRFLLTSAPVNVEGGVASAPNALAIF